MVGLERFDTVRQRDRLFDNLNRFVRAEDEKLTDEGLVREVFQRWSLDRGVHLGDPGDGVDMTGVSDDTY